MPRFAPLPAFNRFLKAVNGYQIITVKIEKPDDINFILGQTRFIKSVEDIHKALVGAVPGITFGLAFCKASGKCLVRCSGTDASMIELAKKNAAAIGAGHSFIVFLGNGFFPLNVLNTLKMVPEVWQVFQEKNVAQRLLGSIIMVTGAILIVATRTESVR